MTPPAAVSWAARLGWLRLENTPLAFLGFAATPYILTLFAIAELIIDKLPKTPTRKTLAPFTARVVTGAFSGAALGAPGGALAGRHALTYYPDLKAADFADQVIWKGDNGPVTAADREAEAHLRHVLLGAYPDDGFLGEEHGEQPSKSGYEWVVDPIDGTRSFVRGVPHWATLVGLVHRGDAIAGVAYEPVIDRTWRAVPPTSRRSASSRPRWRAIMISVFTTAIDVNAKMIATNSGPSHRLVARSASVAVASAARPPTCSPG